MLRLNNVTKEYQLGGTCIKALDKIDLNIGQGEFVAIIGPSGSGKSTLMSLIGCLDTPTNGNVQLLNKEISDLDETGLAYIRQKNIGFVFQTFNLIPSLTAKENIEIPMLFNKTISKKERKERAEELLNTVGLKARANHKPAELSGGERQRIAIARALANNPDIILADEPTGNLDEKTGIEIMQLLQSLHKNGKTIILVTHNLELANQADRIIEIKGGRIE